MASYSNVITLTYPDIRSPSGFIAYILLLYVQLGSFLGCCLIGIAIVGVVHCYCFSKPNSSEEDKRKQDAVQSASIKICALDIFVWPWILPTILIPSGTTSQTLPGVLFILFQVFNAALHVGYFIYVQREVSHSFVPQQEIAMSDDPAHKDEAVTQPARALRTASMDDAIVLESFDHKENDWEILDAALAKHFKRYDVNETGMICGVDELSMLTTNLFFQLDVKVLPARSLAAITNLPDGVLDSGMSEAMVKQWLIRSFEEELRKIPEQT